MSDNKASYNKVEPVSDAESALPARASDVQLYGRLLSYMLPYLPIFFVSVAGFLLAAFMNVLLADILQFLVDALGKNEQINSGIISGALSRIDGFESGNMAMVSIIIPSVLVFIGFFRGIGSFIGSYAVAIVGRRTIHDLRKELFERLIRLPTAFFDASTGGFLVSRITFNVEQVTGAVTKALTVTVREGTTVIALLVYLLFLNWKLSMVFVVAAPFIALIVGSVSKLFRRYSRRIQNSMGDVTHVSSEAVNGHREMRIYGGEPYETDRFASANRENLRQSVKMAATQAAFTPVVQIIVAIAMGAVIFFGLQPAVLDAMSPGKFVAFVTAAGMLMKPIRQLSSVLGTIQKGLAAAQDIFGQLDETPECDEGSHSTPRVRGEVVFDNICFRYGPDMPLVLKNISFSVESGQTVALVGSSGSGKSTLMNLLTRFYRATEGCLTIDGVDVRDYKLDNLREHIALVNQQVILFNDTIHRNIAYGALQGCSPAQVEQAAKIAHADEFIADMPLGMQTLAGDNGVKLSGGQRQRIAIARAILKDAPILIFDEATSALDNESERLIQDALEKVMQGRTTFVVAHRLTTVEKADLILVMEHGEIVESGDHDALLSSGGRYATLYSNQFND